MKKYLLPLLLIGLLSACNGTTSESTQEPTDSVPSSSEVSTSEEVTSSEEELSSSEEVTSVDVSTLAKQEVTFKGSKKTGEIKDTSYASFIDAFNGENGIISSLSTSGYVQINNSGDGFNTLILGSQKVEGSITFTFSKDIKKLEVVTQAYYKTYTSQGVTNTNTDATAELYINDTQFDLSEKTDGVPAIKSIELYPNMKNITFMTKESPARVFLHSMTIYYEA